MNLSLPPSNSTSSANGIQAATGTSTTPESDSFSYMEMILEALAVLGKLGVALETVTQRLSTEIYNLVETTISEVNERVESTSSSNRLSILAPGTGMGAGDGSRASTGVFMSIGSNSTGLRLAALELSVKENSREVLRDLFWTLYSKLDAVVQGLRVISEVSNRIGSVRLSFPGTNTYLTGLLSATDVQRHFDRCSWKPVPTYGAVVARSSGNKESPTGLSSGRAEWRGGQSEPDLVDQ
jgi:exocyst complex component 4